MNPPGPCYHAVVAYLTERAGTAAQIAAATDYRRSEVYTALIVVRRKHPELVDKIKPDILGRPRNGDYRINHDRRTSLERVWSGFRT